MKIHALSFTVTDREVVNTIQRTFEMQQANLPPEAQDKLKNIKNLNLVFASGHLVVSGRFVMGFLPVPFEAHCELTAADGGETLAVRLAKVKASLFSGNGASLISALTSQMPPIDGITASGDTLLIRLAPLLAQRGLEVNGRIRTLDLRPGELTFTLN